MLVKRQGHLQAHSGVRAVVVFEQQYVIAGTIDAVAERSGGRRSGGGEDAVGVMVAHPFHIVYGHDHGADGRTGDEAIVAFDDDRPLLHRHAHRAELRTGDANGFVHQNRSGRLCGAEGGCSKG